MTSGVYNAGLDLAGMLGPPIAGALAGGLGIPATFCIVALTLPTIYYGVWFSQRRVSGSRFQVSRRGPSSS